MQTFQRYEVHFIDAQSTDGTVDKIKALAENTGSAIRWSSEPDSGVYDAMNKGIARATCEWLYFLGADDSLHDPDVFADVAKSLAAQEADLLYGDAVMKRSGAIYGGAFSLDRLLFECNICHQTAFYHRSLFERLGNFNPRYPIWADWELNIRCFRHPAIRTRWLDRKIVVYSDDTGISRDEDPVFRKELPVILIGELEAQKHKVDKLKRKLESITSMSWYRWHKRLFGRLD